MLKRSFQTMISKNLTSHPLSRLSVCFCLLVLLAGCKSEEIKQYRVAKVSETSKLPAAGTSASKAPFSYQVPAGWQEEAGSGMRTASFKTKDGGDISVVILPGMAGDLKGNLNRWRGQVGLEPLNDPQAIQNSVTEGSVDGSKALKLELYSPQGQPDKAMRVALFEKSGVTWFFKLAGTASVVKQHKASFESFLSSVKFKADAQTPEGAAMAQLPAEQGAGSSTEQQNPHPQSGQDSMSGPGMPALEPQKTDTTLSYKLPAKWQEKPASSMRVASFEVKQGEQLADVSVVNLAGDGGGLLSNTNRWRQQLEMAPTDEAGLKNSVKDITVNGHKGYYMALYTGLEGKGMLVALIEQGDQTWFIKMLGPSKLIQNQEQDFQNFVKSIEFHAKGSRA